MMGHGEVVIRSYEAHFDRARVEELERRCEVGPTERVFLFTDTMGDPICRIRNSPVYKMMVMVAQIGDEVVGVIQGSIKLVTVHKPPQNLAKVGYILGLRVAPFYRRRGIGSSLVRRVEDWFIGHDVDYAYMATQKDNQASINLFKNKLGYTRFRTPAIFVNPVKCHACHISSNIQILKLKVEEAEAVYRKHISSIEFFPHDIDYILRHKLSLGTWAAIFREDESRVGKFGANCGAPNSFAVVSVWNSGESFKLRLGKAPLSCFLYIKSSKLVDKIFPCFKLPSIPDFFHPFGFYFMYGVHGEGPLAGKLVGALCKYVHNMAAKSSAGDCKVIVTEIGGEEELRKEIPHWKLLSCPEDLWCIKGLKQEEKNTLVELTKTPHNTSLFVDPREV